MAEWGALGLAIGLWTALSRPGGKLARRDTTRVVLGWILIAMSAVLVLTVTFPASPTRIGPPNCKRPSGCPAPKRKVAPAGLAIVVPGLAEPALSPAGRRDPGGSAAPAG
jgi:hypothetical protein